jgi:hypothetical protein
MTKKYVNNKKKNKKKMNCSYSSCKEKEGSLQSGYCNCQVSYHKKCLYKLLIERLYNDKEKGDKCPICKVQYRINMNNTDFFKGLIKKYCIPYVIFLLLYIAIAIVLSIYLIIGTKVLTTNTFLGLKGWSSLMIVSGLFCLIWILVEYEEIKQGFDNIAFVVKVDSLK